MPPFQILRQCYQNTLTFVMKQKAISGIIKSFRPRGIRCSETDKYVYIKIRIANCHIYLSN